MGTIYQCLKRDDRYTPPLMSVMHEASNEGYEDVHPQLVAEDAIGDRWPSYETLMPNA